MHYHSGPNVYDVGTTYPALDADVIPVLTYEWDSVSYVNREWDYIYSLIVGSVISGFPVHLTHDSTRMEVLHSKVVRVPYDSERDANNYASPWSNFLYLRKFLFDQGRSEGAGREYQCVHGSTIGDAYGNFNSFHEGDVNVSYLNTDVASPSYRGWPNAIDLNGLPTGASNTLVGGVRPAFTQALALINSKAITDQEFDWEGWIMSHKGPRAGHVKILSFRFDVTDTGYLLSYTQRARRDHGNPSNGEYDEVTVKTSVSLVFRVQVNRNSSVISPVSGFFELGSITITDTFSDWLRSSELPGSTSAFGQHISSMYSTQTIYGIPFGEAGSYLFDQATIDSTIQVLRSEDERLRALFDQYRGHSYKVAGLAISSYDELVKSICLESIVELSKLTSLIPNIGPVSKFLDNVVGRRNLLSAGLHLVDFASNTYLLYKFGLVPFKDLIMNFSVEYDAIRQGLLRKTRGTHNLYGKDSLQIDDGPLAGYRLTTRCKLVLGFPEECVAMALLPLRYGNLSKLQDLWNLVPFSFVVDWFIKASDRISSVDSSLFALTGIVNYAVHSYTLQAPLGDVLEIPNVDISNVDYEFYLRSVSRHYPGHSSSYIDFWSGSSPPLLLGGALLYSLVRP